MKVHHEKNGMSTMFALKSDEKQEMGHLQKVLEPYSKLTRISMEGFIVYSNSRNI